MPAARYRPCEACGRAATTDSAGCRSPVITAAPALLTGGQPGRRLPVWAWRRACSRSGECRARWLRAAGAPMGGRRRQRGDAVSADQSAPLPTHGYRVGTCRGHAPAAGCERGRAPHRSRRAGARCTGLQPHTGPAGDPVVRRWYPLSILGNSGSPRRSQTG